MIKHATHDASAQGCPYLPSKGKCPLTKCLKTHKKFTSKSNQGCPYFPLKRPFHPSKVRSPRSCAHNFARKYVSSCPFPNVSSSESEYTSSSNMESSSSEI
ncbi:hypothetical protein HMI56_004669 [Coelomomyces lativittatus]|nr:hypothetical protein HMI56_004669 [Coelomomyces lativittatus]